MPLPKARKYKVTFTGPHYAIGELVNVRGNYRKIITRSCLFVVRDDGKQSELTQNQWHYTIEADNLFPDEVYSEYDLYYAYMEQ